MAADPLMIEAVLVLELGALIGVLTGVATGAVIGSLVIGSLTGAPTIYRD